MQIFHILPFLFLVFLHIVFICLTFIWIFVLLSILSSICLLRRVYRLCLILLLILIFDLCLASLLGVAIRLNLVLHFFIFIVLVLGDNIWATLALLSKYFILFSFHLSFSISFACFLLSFGRHYRLLIMLHIVNSIKIHIGCTLFACI